MGKNKNYKSRNKDVRNFKPKYQRTNSNKTHRGHSGDGPPIVKNSLIEDQVNITEYVSNTAGFNGVIKARFSDFHVNEIDHDGNEVKLTDLTVPEPVEEAFTSEEQENAKEELKSILTEDVWGKINDLLEAEECTNTSIDIDVTDLDKEKRTLIHKTIKNLHGCMIKSVTVQDGDKKIIKLTRSKGKAANERTRWLWPGEYVHFVLHKENVDTIQAASDIALQLRIQGSTVNYAGTKDKRGKTTQKFCIKKREPLLISRAIKRYPYLNVGNFEFKDKVIKLGDLKGNRFRIVLRHITADEELIEECLKCLKEYGFINYYGLQRFGNCASLPTYEIGKALLKGDYKQACELILKPREGGLDILKDVREFWWKNRNAAEAAAMISNKKFIEKKLLDGLAKFGDNDYANSLRKIPRNMLLLYTHSYQSLIWNKVASRRIKDFGLKPIPGDLVYNDDIVDENGSVLELVNVHLIDESVEEESGEIGEQEPELEAQKSIYKLKVRPLTEEDILSGKHSIFDIILPLPGYDITYPSNEVGKWYEEILAQDDLSSEKLKRNIKTYSLAGAYRKLIIKPENMNWEFKRYNDPTCTLIASDYENLVNLKADDDNPEGKFKALLLDFTLPASSYATMALRELLKIDTSASTQTKLNEEEMLKATQLKNEEQSNNYGDSNLSSSDHAGEISPECTNAVETAKRSLDEDEEKSNKKLKVEEVVTLG